MQLIGDGGRGWRSLQYLYTVMLTSCWGKGSYKDTHARTHAHTHAHRAYQIKGLCMVNKLKHTHTNTYARAHSHIHTHTHTQRRARLHSFAHSCAPPPPPPTHTHTHTHTRCSRCPWSCWCESGRAPFCFFPYERHRHYHHFHRDKYCSGFIVVFLVGVILKLKSLC